MLQCEVGPIVMTECVPVSLYDGIGERRANDVRVPRWYSHERPLFPMCGALPCTPSPPVLDVESPLIVRENPNPGPFEHWAQVELTPSRPELFVRITYPYLCWGCYGVGVRTMEYQGEFSELSSCEPYLALMSALNNRLYRPYPIE